MQVANFPLYDVLAAPVGQDIGGKVTEPPEGSLRFSALLTQLAKTAQETPEGPNPVTMPMTSADPMPDLPFAEAAPELPLLELTDPQEETPEDDSDRLALAAMLVAAQPSPITPAAPTSEGQVLETTMVQAVSIDEPTQQIIQTEDRAPQPSQTEGPMPQAEAKESGTGQSATLPPISDHKPAQVEIPTGSIAPEEPESAAKPSTLVEAKPQTADGKSQTAEVKPQAVEPKPEPPQVTESSSQTFALRELDHRSVKVGETYQADTTSSDFPKQLSQQVDKALAAGEQRITITLTPEHLGTVELELTRSEDGALHLKFQAASEKAVRLLNAHTSDLGLLLRSNVNAPVQIEVQQSTESQQQEQQRGDDQGHGHQSGQQQQQNRHQEQETLDFMDRLRLGIVTVSMDAG